MTTAPARRRPGRPKGTTYAAVDAHVHDMMRLLLVGRCAPSLTEAARQLAHLAYGSGTDEAKIRRLVRTYPYNRGNAAG